MSDHSKKLSLAHIRQDYASQDLNEANALPDALQQFGLWMQQALDSKILEPTAMILSTANNAGQPSARVVLLKAVDAGFVFFTNYQSHKGAALAENPQAALTFFWPQLERQVRVEGITEKVSEEESDEYFNSRPRESQIGAWASPQSQVISDRNMLEKRVNAMIGKFPEEISVSRPAHWGGYRLLPQKIEFWQGRPSRLHDRLLYSKSETGWEIERLAP